MAKSMRLDRFLAEMGVGTRSQIREAAKKGRIQVDGVVETKSDRKIDPEAETVTVDGAVVAYAEFEYYMLNKPQGVVSATEDNLHRTVVELITSRRRGDLFPVGRLDIDTEGLLLITNDGDLVHRLLSPKRHVDKRYLAIVEGELPADAEKRFAEGLVLKDQTAVMPAVLEIRKKMEGSCEVLLTIHEGKFHQVKRMFEALDCRVTALKRLSMGPLELDQSLRPGDWRPLTEEEIAALRGQKESGKEPD